MRRSGRDIELHDYVDQMIRVATVNVVGNLPSAMRHAESPIERL
jgi:hypothetical protein